MPVTAIPTNNSFAIPRPKSSSPKADLAASDDLFCAVCVKNQHFFTECLSNYLPPEDDTRYSEFEAAYPEYKRKLEIRYPQVCVKCEPRVRARLRQSAYVANSDNLTKALARPRNNRLPGARRDIEWTAAGLRAVGCTFYGSLLVQWLWHIVGVLGMLDYDRHLEEYGSVNALFCIYAGARTLHLGPACSTMLVKAVAWSLLCSVVVCWWNPTMIEKYRRGRRTRKTVGQGDFYRMQACIFGLRCTVWLALQLDSYKHDTVRGCHGFMACFIILGAIVSHRVIALAPLPKISFKDIDKPLVDTQSFQYPDEDFSSQRSARPPTEILRTPSAVRHFPIHRLAPPLYNPTPSLTSPTHAPLTPPPEDDTDVDSMDWEPVSQTPNQRQAQSLEPRSVRAQAEAATVPQSNPAVPSPFYGRLPAAPKSMEHRLRNNARQPAPQFHPVPASKQQDWFQKMRLSSSTMEPTTKKAAPKQQLGSTSSQGSSDYIRSLPQPDQRMMDLREPRWTLKSDLDAATKGTGLEDLFTSSFKIDDEPSVQTRANPADTALAGPELRTDFRTAALNVMSFVALSVFCGVGAMILEMFRRGQGLADVMELFRSMGEKAVAWVGL